MMSLGKEKMTLSKFGMQKSHNQEGETRMIIRDDELRKLLEHSLKCLFENEERIIFRKVKEEAINHRFAVYLENNIRNNFQYSFLNVDLEYNKNYDMDKEIIGTDGEIHKIRPDILMHLREDNYNNKIAFECKIGCLSIKDKHKLLMLKNNPYNYENCIGIVYKPDRDYFFIYHVEDDRIIKSKKKKKEFSLS
jgi:hypothetical protein